MPAPILGQGPKGEDILAHCAPFPDPAADEKAQLVIVVWQAAASHPRMAKQNQISAALFPS